MLFFHSIQLPNVALYIGILHSTPPYRRRMAAPPCSSSRPPSQQPLTCSWPTHDIRYHSCGQKRLAMQAYRYGSKMCEHTPSSFHTILEAPHLTRRQVLGVYKGRSWRSIEEHINDVLGRQQKELAMAAAAAAASAGGGGGGGPLMMAAGASAAADDSTLRAMGHFMALLDCGSRPQATQQHYLDQFIELARKVQTKQVCLEPGVREGRVMSLFLVTLPCKGCNIFTSPQRPQDGSQAIEGLPLPAIDVRDVRSHYGDTACFGNSEARAQPPVVWTRLESCVRCVCGWQIFGHYIKAVDCF